MRRDLIEMSQRRSSRFAAARIAAVSLKLQRPELAAPYVRRASPGIACGGRGLRRQLGLRVQHHKDAAVDVLRCRLGPTARGVAPEVSLDAAVRIRFERFCSQSSCERVAPMPVPPRRLTMSTPSLRCVCIDCRTSSRPTRRGALTAPRPNIAVLDSLREFTGFILGEDMAQRKCPRLRLSAYE